jgi:hypothetical protein
MNAQSTEADGESNTDDHAGRDGEHAIARTETKRGPRYREQQPDRASQTRRAPRLAPAKLGSRALSGVQ